MARKIMVGMSGGVDSSVAAYLLKKQGYEVTGVTFKLWDDPTLESGCCSADDVRDAAYVCQQLGIPHYVLNYKDLFRQEVVGPFAVEYLRGRTPNPCVMCNPVFKFRVLAEWADKLGCDYIATGHYVRVKEEGGRYGLYCGVDGKKDQSYFLWRLGQDVLSRCIFPLGALRKEDVRGYLARKGFEMKARGGESLEVCFIDKDYREFLREQVPDLDRRVGEGKFVDVQGRVIGTHCGFPYFTVGQRKGLGIALGKPAYVLRLNARKNTVMLGDAENLEACAMLVCGGRISSEADWADGQLSVRIRYRSRPIPCSVRQVKNRFPEEGGGENLWLVRFKEKASAVTPGQSAVFYVGDKMAGGAYIGSQRGLQAYLED